LKEAKEYGAATAATKVVDTIKVADDNGFIKKTIDRTYIWAVQTPQVFDVSAYNNALQKAKLEQISVTDDCMLFENAGYPVKLVDTGSENIKITVKDDIRKAEAILLTRGEK
jgi:2-C-methyl-D-erythritol 4-phosphate cytidylyltransferase